MPSLEINCVATWSFLCSKLNWIGYFTYFNYGITTISEEERVWAAATMPMAFTDYLVVFIFAILFLFLFCPD